MPTTQIAVVGAGLMAETHCAAYGRLEDTTVAAVVSPTSAPAFVEEHDLDATAFSDLDAALDAPIDAVDICTPTPTHPKYVRRAVSAGLPTLCEKPLATSLAAARSLRDGIADTAPDVPVQVGHVLRFFPEYATAKSQVEAGRIGSPGVARARRLSPFPDWGDWYADRDRSGGVFLDLAVHDFDFLRWTVGEVEDVFARRTRDDEFEHGSVTLAFENGATGYVEASWGQPASRPLTYEFELAGDDGVISYDSAEDAPVQQFTASETTTESPTGPADGYVKQLTHFVDCVRTGTEPRVGLDDAIEAIRIAAAAERSAARGEPVSLGEVSA